jgi:hypothetical protein
MYTNCTFHEGISTLGELSVHAQNHRFMVHTTQQVDGRKNKRKIGFCGERRDNHHSQASCVKCQNDLHGNTKKDHFKTNKSGDHFFA